MSNPIHSRVSQLGVQARVIGTMIVCLITLLILFNGYTLYAISSDTDHALTEFSNTLGQTLAQSSRLALIEGNYDDLHQTIAALISSNAPVLKIEILDAKKDVILFQKAATASVGTDRVFLYPITQKKFAPDIISRELAAPGGREKNATPKKSFENVIGYVQLSVSPDTILAQHTRRALLRSMALLLCALFSLAVPIWLAGRIAVPLRRALAALHTIRDGKYNQQVKVTTAGEIGDLQKTINQITCNMDESIIELENKVTARTVELQKSRDAIARSDTEKRRLIQKVHSIVEDERKSIAAEIHDELNATLIAAKLSSQQIMSLASAEDINPNKDQIQSHAQNIIHLTSSLYASARNIVRRLRPEILDMLGLEGAINDMVESYDSMQPQCHFSFTSEGDLSAIPGELDITVYRLIQEALSNVMKHAGASAVHVFINNDAQKKQLLVSVTDNGHGFSPKLNETGIGIIGMKERAYAFHGDFDIISQEGRGTTVLAVFPLT